MYRTNDTYLKGVANMPDIEDATTSQADVTNDDDRQVTVAMSNLSTQQAVAMSAIVRGSKLADAANAAGVDRATLYRWRTSDPHFITALNAWRAEQQSHAKDRLLTAANLATDAVVQGLEKGDARLGLRVLKELGCAAAGPTKPVDPFDGAFDRLHNPEQADNVRRAMVMTMKLIPYDLVPHAHRCLRLGVRLLCEILLGDRDEGAFRTTWPSDRPDSNGPSMPEEMPPIDKSLDDPQGTRARLRRVWGIAANVAHRQQAADMPIAVPAPVDSQ